MRLPEKRLTPLFFFFLFFFFHAVEKALVKLKEEYEKV
jgi:hypothetical protein